MIGFHPVDGKTCSLNSLALMQEVYRLNGNQWKIKTLVKEHSEVYSGQISTDEVCLGQKPTVVTNEPISANKYSPIHCCSTVRLFRVNS